MFHQNIGKNFVLLWIVASLEIVCLLYFRFETFGFFDVRRASHKPMLEIRSTFTYKDEENFFILAHISPI